MWYSLESPKIFPIIFGNIVVLLIYVIKMSFLTNITAYTVSTTFFLVVGRVVERSLTHRFGNRQCTGKSWKRSSTTLPSLARGLSAGLNRARPKPRTKSRTRKCVKWAREEALDSSQATSISSRARLERGMAKKGLAVIVAETARRTPSSVRTVAGITRTERAGPRTGVLEVLKEQQHLKKIQGYKWIKAEQRGVCGVFHYLGGTPAWASDGHWRQSQKGDMAQWHRCTGA